MKNPELQRKCLNKLGMSSEHSGTNLKQIQRVASKQEPLTAEDIEQLSHFINSDKRRLEKTVYWGNVIVEPSTYNNKYYRKMKAEGWIETTKNYSRIHNHDK